MYRPASHIRGTLSALLPRIIHPHPCLQTAERHSNTGGKAVKMQIHLSQPETPALPALHPFLQRSSDIDPIIPEAAQRQDSEFPSAQRRRAASSDGIRPNSRKRRTPPSYWCAADENPINLSPKRPCACASFVENVFSLV